MNTTRLKNLFILTALGTSLCFTSCKKDKDEDPNPVTPEETIIPSDYSSGIFVTCEGPFVGGSGTVSFYNRNNGNVSNNLFQSVNGLPLGSIVQSMEVYGGKGYIVVNNAGKVEVVNSSTFSSTGKISGLEQPRYFLGISATKGYVTQWGSSGANKGVKIIDLSSNASTGLISTGSGPESMAMAGNFVYVANSGGFASDSTVTVINSTTDAVATTIKVGDAPNSVAVDKNGKIWVLCGGVYGPPETAGKLVRINPTTNTIEATFNFSNTSAHPNHLCINKTKDVLYYLSSGEICAFPIGSTSLSSAIINRNFYSLGVDPQTDLIYAGNAGNFTSNGYVLRFNSASALIDSFQVGIIPGNFCFR